MSRRKKMADISYCAGSDKCAKRFWCKRAFYHAPENMNRMSVADFYKDYDKANDFCPHFWEYRE